MTMYPSDTGMSGQRNNGAVQDDDARVMRASKPGIDRNFIVFGRHLGVSDLMLWRVMSMTDHIFP